MITLRGSLAIVRTNNAKGGPNVMNAHPTNSVTVMMNSCTEPERKDPEIVLSVLLVPPHATPQQRSYQYTV